MHCNKDPEEFLKSLRGGDLIKNIQQFKRKKKISVISIIKRRNKREIDRMMEVAKE
jgi:hypothetical protein